MPKKRNIPWNKGLTKYTDERVKKISEAMKGRIFTEEHRKNLSKALTGHKLSEETRNKLSGGKNHMYGKKLSDEHKKKISGEKNGMYGKYGENHPCWKGGISCEPYCDVWIDKEYKESIKERDNYTCQNPFCLCDSSDIVLHHINYVKKDCKPNNLITVCNSSNSRANGDRWVWQEIYERKIQAQNI